MVMYTRTRLPAPPHHAPVRIAFAATVLCALAAGVAGGLVRAGVPLPAGAGWLTEAVAAHAFLMVCAVLGTLIGLERAVAVRHPLAFAAPAASGLAGITTLAGAPHAGALLAAAASLAFVGVNVVVARRQRAPHTALLLVAAAAWCIGSLAYAIGAAPGAVVPWWLDFLVLTIAAERLEMTRLMRQRPGATPALHALCAGLLAGAALSGAMPLAGGLLHGAALAGLAAWLLCFDVARRTFHAHGLSRYMACCLMAGYAWLAAAGLAWMATSLGLPWRDAALHGVALGFVFSMMFGHAPVILPAVARVRLRFGRVFYLPLALLHLGLALRLVGGHADARLLALGAAANAAAIAVFFCVVVASALARARDAA